MQGSKLTKRGKGKPKPPPAAAAKQAPRKSRRIRRAERGFGNGVEKVRPIAAPTAVGSRITQRPSSSATATGTLVLAEVAVGDIGPNTRPVTFINLNPFLFGVYVGGVGSALGGTISNRLVAMAECFARWRVKSLKIRYQPACASTVNGMLMLSYNENPNLALTALLGGSGTPLANDNMPLLYQTLTNFPSMEINLWAQATWNIPVADKSWKQVDPMQAIGLYATNASAGIVSAILHDISATPLTYGTLHMDYDLEFCDPVWTPSLATIGSVLAPTFTANSGLVTGVPLNLSYDGLAGSQYASFFSGPFIFVPHSDVVYSSPASTNTLFAGIPYIGTLYNTPSYPTSNQFLVYKTLGDLNADNPIDVQTGPSIGVVFQADVLALSSFGA